MTLEKRVLDTPVGPMYEDASGVVIEGDTIQTAVRKLQTQIGSSAGNSGSSPASGSVDIVAGQFAEVTLTRHGQYVRAPDATTLTTGGPKFIVKNNSAYWCRALDFDGTLIGFIPPHGSIQAFLMDNTTSAGRWDLVGSAMFGISGLLRPGASYLPGDTNGVRVLAYALDSDRELVMWGGKAVYAVVYTRSTAAFGSIASVRATVDAGCWAACLTTTSNQALVVSCATTAMEAVVLSISGTTITVESGTKGTATLGGSTASGSFGDLMAVGSTYWIAYSRATTTQEVRAVSISSVTPSIGSAASLSTTSLAAGASGPTYANAHIYPVTSTVALLVFMVASGGTLTAKPYSVSGNTLTAGTGVDVSAFCTRWRDWDFTGGYFGIVYNTSTTAWNAGVVTVSGTVATESHVATMFSMPANGGYPEVMVVNSTHALVVMSPISGNAIYKYNILGHAAGTAGGGSTQSITLDQTNSSQSPMALVSLNGTDVRGVVTHGYSATALAPVQGWVFTFDCSGATPAISAQDSIGFTAPIPFSVRQNYNNARAPGVIRSAQGYASITCEWIANQSGIGLWGGASPIGVLPLVVGNSEHFYAPEQPMSINTTLARMGEGGGNAGVIDDYTSWLCTVPGSVGGQATLYRVSGNQ